MERYESVTSRGIKLLENVNNELLKVHGAQKFVKQKAPPRLPVSQISADLSTLGERFMEVRHDLHSFIQKIAGEAFSQERLDRLNAEMEEKNELAFSLSLRLKDVLSTIDNAGVRRG